MDKFPYESDKDDEPQRVTPVTGRLGPEDEPARPEQSVVDDLHVNNDEDYDSLDDTE
jgi:hypothetical protein